MIAPSLDVDAGPVHDGHDARVTGGGNHESQHDVAEDLDGSIEILRSHVRFLLVGEVIFGVTQTRYGLSMSLPRAGFILAHAGCTAEFCPI